MSAETTTEPRRADSPVRPRPSGRDPIGLPAVRGRRRPWLVAVGVLLAALGALTVVWLVGAAGQRIEVLVVRQQVPSGQAIADEDLGLARVSVDPGVSVVTSADRARVVGQFASTELQPGMLLAADMVSADGGPEPGQAFVPLAVGPERMPASGLRPGDRILVVDAGDPVAGTASSRTYAATVERVGATDVNGVTVVDVTTSTGEAPGLAVAAANGRVAIVVRASRG